MSGNPSVFKRPKIDLFELPESVETTSAWRINSLPDLIRFNALNNPHYVFCVQSKGIGIGNSDSSNITFLELAHAVEQCCNWILANIETACPDELSADGSPAKGRPTALFMESDVSLFIYLAALLTLNVPCVLLSIRLSPSAIVHLLEETGSSSIIVSERTRSNVENALLGRVVSASDSTSPSTSGSPYSQTTSIKLAAPAEEFLNLDLRSPSTPTLAILGRWLADRQTVRHDDRNVLILHSSGTTGLPKAIPLAHRYLLGYAACHLFAEDEDESIKGINLSTLPLFHGFGLLAPCLALSVGKTFCLPPSSTIPTGSLVVSLIQQRRDITSLMTVPTILEEITLQDNFNEAVTVLAALDFVAVGGGGMNATVGEIFHLNGVSLLNHFGATELGALAPIFRPDKDYDYRYLRLRKDLDLRLEKIDSDQDDENGICRLIGHPFAWDQEFELQDRLQSNPLKPDSEVRILGRNDDLIVLSTGEKVLPYLIEQTLSENSLIRRAIVFGNNESQVGILIEPTFPLTESHDIFIERIWPSVLKANALVDSHACISTKAAVLIKPAEKLIPLSDKGEPQRKEVYSTFDSEIKKIYETLAGNSNDMAVPLDIKNPRLGIRMLVQSHLPAHCKEGTWGDDDDFIHLGMDSLQATSLRRILNSSLLQVGYFTNGVPDLPRDFIYSHPSVSKVVQSLTTQSNGVVTDYDPEQDLVDLTLKYSYHVPDSRTEQKSTILLTGSTGNLGAHLLQVLCESPLVHLVICLVRSSTDSSTIEDLASRQQSVFEARGIVLSAESWSKIEFLKWTSGEEFLGLNQEVYQRLASQITHIFHGAWPMDFKRKLPSFEPQIRTVKDLVDLGIFAHSLNPYRRPKIVLASSIAVVGRYGPDKSSAVVPERPMDDSANALPMGYAQAKWICEKVIESAHVSLRSQVQAVIIRIGQVSGSQATGFWSSGEHFPALMKASQAIGKLPDLQGTLSWLPVDQTAQATADILLDTESQDLIFHVENPVRQSWPDVCTILEQNLGFRSAQRLPFQEWLDEVEKNNGYLESLMHFFQNYFLRMSGGGLILDTSQSRAVSQTLRLASAVSQESVERYLDFWMRTGFLETRDLSN